VLVVSIPEESGFAPGRTFAIAYDHLFDQPTAACGPPGCGHLPGLGVVSGSYLVSPQVTLDLDWNLGNAPTEQDQGQDIAIPVHASYRPLWGSSSADAAGLGLPVETVQAIPFAIERGGAPGVGGGPSMAFDAYLQATTAGGPPAYVRTLSPDPPFDQAFPPEIRTVQVTPTTAPFELDPIKGVEKTREEPELGPSIPTFDIARAGGLDGWTAYLRDATTHQIISNVRPLAGQSVTGVILATNYVPPRADALSNAQLVLAPAPGTPAPTGVFAPLAGVLPEQETYPPIAPPVEIDGSVSASDGTPVDADLVFEATAIIDQSGKANVANFEYVGSASTARDPRTGAAAYSVILPEGRYRVAIRPRDGAGAVTFVDPLVIDTQRSTLSGIDFTALPLRPVRGSASVIDGRSLSGATVVAVPAQCLQGQGSACMPRGADTQTDAQGNFALSLDPGVYSLSIQPGEGTALPWVHTSLTVDAAPVVVTPPPVPAPVQAGLELRDPADSPIIRAVVRAFALSSTGPAVELGRAITDASGRYSLYLAPGTP
jgi:hypothetical protein